MALDFCLLSISKILLSISPKKLKKSLLSIITNSNGCISANIRNWAMLQVGHRIFLTVETTFVWGVSTNSALLKRWLSVVHSN